MTQVAAGAAENYPRVDPELEVRFAVVMYGGSSLAIYMNGVSQELLRLVRATAPAGPHAAPGDRALLAETSLESTERIYRELGRMLPGYESVDDSVEDSRRPQVRHRLRPIRRRFVVDILSGSSAGGINAIFLAKALANDQSIRALENLWVEEGDIGVLVNDRRSVRGIKGLKADPVAPSLLNGKRMLRKLLDAFEGMEGDVRSTKVARSPYVEELDLFVTATDLAGLPLSMRLANGMAYERRHRNVFHFVYGTEHATGEECNDFHADNNPFLAFAARCTSSLPFVFEPIRLADVDEALTAHPAFADRTQFRAGTSSDTRSPPEEWARRFYAEYKDKNFRGRYFGDGGSLDNSPFSHATGSLYKRNADLPVERKLVYVEPDPADPDRQDFTRPDALQNLLQQVVTLPRYQTITEDLQRVNERNRVIRRVASALEAVERATEVLRPSQRGSSSSGADERAAPADGGNPESTPAVEWRDQGLEKTLRQRGAGYAGYQKLKVEAVTRELAELVARLIGVQEDSDDVTAILLLVAAWRDMTYDEFEERRRAQDAPTFNRFLSDYDLSYRLRRIVFVQRKIDRVRRLDDESRGALESAEVGFWPRDVDEGKEFRGELTRLKRCLAGIQVDLRGAERELLGPESVLRPLMKPTGIGEPMLRELLELPESQRRPRAGELAEQHKEALQRLGDGVAKGLQPAFLKAAEDWRQAVSSSGQAPLSKAVRAARRYLDHYYRSFDDFDAVAFPIQYGTDAGESAVVEIMRISPTDADAICTDPERKVAGLKYGHFGAFFSRPWRENDILWGRLDAAECLICALAPDGPERTKLIRAAVNEILKDTLARAGGESEVPSERAKRRARASGRDA